MRPNRPAAETAPPPPDDVPVVAVRARHDGWTPDRQRRFIQALAECGVVTAAADAVGMSAKSAYALRRRAGPDHGFVRAWDDALASGSSAALSAAISLALHGRAVPVFYRGLKVGERIEHDHRLLLAALRVMDRRARAAIPPPGGIGSPPWR